MYALLSYVGTGKSTVGAHLAYAFAKLNRITKKTSPSEKTRCVVYCGSSNVSVDVVASTYMYNYVHRKSNMYVSIHIRICIVQ